MTEHQIRRVPTALLIAVVVQTVGGLVWAGGAAARIATLEEQVGEQRLVAERLARLEEQGAATRASVEWAASWVIRKLGHITPRPSAWQARLCMQTATALA